MAFHISKFRHLLRISSARVKPTPKTRPFITNYFRYRIESPPENLCLKISQSQPLSYSSTGKSLPENKSKSTNNSPSYFNSLITQHGRKGNVRGAEEAFARMPKNDVISRSNMISVYGQNGEIEKARKMFDEMPERTTSSYNAMITAYGKSNMADRAYEVFSSMPERSAVSYGAMISGFVRARMLDQAEKLLSETPSEFRDPVCSGSLLQGYLKKGNLNDAYRIFDAMAVRDVVSWSSMVDGFCKAGRVAEARGFFDAMPERNVVTWTSMIHGYLKNGDFERGFELFSSMRREKKRVEFNSDTLAVMFGGCGSFSKLKEGLQIHGLASRVGFEFEEFLGNSMVTMYSRFGDMVSAAKIFRDMVEIDVVTWNSLIYGYVQCGDIERALETFEKMPRKSVSLWRYMISALFSNGLAEKAVRIFETMPLKKDRRIWASLISGLLNNDRHDEAFRWFNKLLRDEGIGIDSDVFCSIVIASASINQGAQFHGLLIKKNMESELSIQNALAVFYSKCGCFSEVEKVFANI